MDVEFDYQDTLSEYKSRLKILKWSDSPSSLDNHNRPKMRLGFIPLWAISTITGDPAKDGKLNINLCCGRILTLQNEDKACSVKLLMEFMAFQVNEQKQNRTCSRTTISQALRHPIQRGVLKIQNTTGQFPSELTHPLLS